MVIYNLIRAYFTLIFLTLEAPGAGNHPVSGTRPFGFNPYRSGSYSFLIKSIDRMTNLPEAIGQNVLKLILGLDLFGLANPVWNIKPQKAFTASIKWLLNSIKIQRKLS